MSVERLLDYEARLLPRIYGAEPHRPWHERMQQARRWHQQRLTADQRRPPNYAEQREMMANIAAKNGRTLAADYTHEQWLEAYRRVIRRNLMTKGRLP